MKKSLWLEAKKLVSTTELTQDSRCEICVAGGGLSGIYTAYLLAKNGHDVLLLEGKESIGAGATSFSTGKLTVQHGLKYSKLPLEDAKIYYEANHQAIERLLEHLPPSLYNRSTSYIYATTEQGKMDLQKEYEAYQEIGIPSHATKETELPFDVMLALGIENEVQVDPTELVTHLANLAIKEGVRIHTNSRVTAVNEDYVQLANDARVHFQKLILCTHYPISSLPRMYTAKLAIKRSYLTASPTSEPLKGQYISVDDPTRTLRTAEVAGKLYFVYGGGEHPAGTVTETDNYYDTFTQELQTIFNLPAPEYLWSNQDMQTPDDVPYAGPFVNSSDKIYIATGYDQWGLSNSLVAGEILASYMDKQEHPASAIYKPTRHQGLEGLQEGLKNTGFMGAEFVKGHVARNEAPTCTHLGCKTRWNEGDKTWDCPCHGSRFNAKGQVIEGPAVYPLELDKKDA